jgi:hypothetical protein
MSARGTVATLGVLVGGLLALPGVSVGQTAAQDAVVGSVQTPPDDVVPSGFSVDAHSGPSGENPVGTIRWGSGHLIEHAAVTCLAVTGHTAVVGFTGEGSLSVLLSHWAFVGFVRIVDAGVGIDTVERAFTFVGPDVFIEDPIEPAPGPLDCSSFPSGGGSPFTYGEGDIVVTDAQPLPTAKDECKNGGWRNYGTKFQNQGQCVAFVVRQGCRVQRGTITYRDPYCANPLSLRTGGIP